MYNLPALIYQVQLAPNVLLKISEELKFTGHCLANADETQSQNYQDIFALYATGYKRDGFFVEFGATDGKSISNTLLLEKKYGWTGILAEPNPVWHDSLRYNRGCLITDYCVYSKTGEIVEFLASEASDISGIKAFADKDEHAQNRLKGETIQVHTISLLDLLKKFNAPQYIDYLSIDTEGSELHILEAFFAENTYYDIKVITVEHNFVDEIREKLYHLLASKGYKRKFAEFSRCDDFYVKG